MKNQTLFDSRDVLDPNARVRRSFTGKIVGRFKRTGPNSWDPYTLEMMDSDVITVLPGVKVYVDPSSSIIRMRRKGDVVVVEWIPDKDEATGELDAANMRRIFVDRFLAPFGNRRGFGPAAAIARKLSR